MAQGGLVFALVFGLIAVASAALAGSPGTCAASCTGWCDWSNNCCTLPSNCAEANCAAAGKCTKTQCTKCNNNYFLDGTSKGCCSLTGTGLTGVCIEASCDANGANVKCTKCAAGYFVSNNVCAACTLTGCNTAASCDAAGANTKCATCNTGRVLATDGKCCTALANCATHSTCTSETAGAVCSVCNPGYVLSAGACVACSANNNCATLKCTTTTSSLCASCPAAGAGGANPTWTMLAADGNCCTPVATCASLASCTVTRDAAGAVTGTASPVCASCVTSTRATTTTGTGGAAGTVTDGSAYRLATGACTACTPPADDTTYVFDWFCTTWGCDATTNMCITCAAGESLSADKRCGPTITGCSELTTVDFVTNYPVDAVPTYTLYSRCATTTAGVTTNKCVTGTYYVAGAAITAATPTSDACTTCPVPATATNCAKASCTGAAAANFVACIECNAGHYLDAGVCKPHSTCAAGTYQTAAGTKTANTVCTTCSTCANGLFKAKDCTATVDTICAPCKVTCDECKTSTCLDGCTTCNNNYVFTDPATECELACGNGEVNDDLGEQCDETVSGECENCQCNEGFWPDNDGICRDIPECEVYGCAFNSAEAVECSEPEPNHRVCACKDERLVRSSTSAEVDLEGGSYFNGCTDADLSEEDFVKAVIANPQALEFIFHVWYHGAVVDSVDAVEEDERAFTINFSLPDGTVADVDDLANSIKNYYFELFGIALSDMEVAVVQEPDTNNFAAAVVLSETALDSASMVAPVLSAVAVLLMLIR